MRLATVIMSLKLAGALTFAPEPIVMATSFSVKVWQICMQKWLLVSSDLQAMTKQQKFKCHVNFCFMVVSLWIPDA